jgi:hypothetical protein
MAVENVSILSCRASRDSRRGIPGGFRGLQLQVTLLGGKVATLDIPMQRTAPAQQEAGVCDQYSGSLQLGDIPVIGLQACVIGVNSVLGLESIGFVVKSS